MPRGEAAREARGEREVPAAPAVQVSPGAAPAPGAEVGHFCRALPKPQMGFFFFFLFLFFLVVVRYTRTLLLLAGCKCGVRARSPAALLRTSPAVVPWTVLVFPNADAVPVRRWLSVPCTQALTTAGPLLGGRFYFIIYSLFIEE